MPRHQRNAEREQFWRRHINQHDVGNLTIRDYCHEYGLSEPSFYSWRRILAQRDRQAAPATPGKPAFLPVAVVDDPDPHDHPSIEIQLGTQHRVRVRNGCDRGLLADVLALLHSQAAREEKTC